MRGGRPPMGGSEPPIMGEGNFPDDMGERPMMNKEQNVEDIQKKAAEAKKEKDKKNSDSGTICKVANRTGYCPPKGPSDEDA